MTLDQWLVLHGKYEKYARPIFQKALKQSYKPIIDSVELITYENYKELISILLDRNPMLNAYVRVYTKIGIQHANIIGKELNSIEKAFNRDIFGSKFLSAISDFILTNLGLRITEVNNYTIELIQNLFKTGLERNYTITQMRIYLVKQLNSPKFDRARATRIARTESTTAANYGAFKASEESELVLDKEWLSVIDDRTRHSHLIENGQIVPQFERFKMSSGVLLMYPGDQNGIGSKEKTASEVINCRCSYNLIERRDSNGRLVRKR